jgi:hypothetical protein
MLGKIYPACLGKYVLKPYRRKVARYRNLNNIAINTVLFLALPALWLDIQKGMVYN